MTDNPASVVEEPPLEDVVTLIESRRIKRVPVVRGTRVVGIVNLPTYFMRWRGSPARPSPPLPMTRLFAKIFLQRSTVSVGPRRCARHFVQNGVVDLGGWIPDERERRALIVASENTAGVKAVRITPHGLIQCRGSPSFRRKKVHNSRRRTDCVLGRMC